MAVPVTSSNPKHAFWMNEARLVIEEQLRNRGVKKYENYARVFGEWMKIPAGQEDKFKGFTIIRKEVI